MVISWSAVIKVHWHARRCVSTCKIQAQICINTIEIVVIVVPFGTSLILISPHLISPAITPPKYKVGILQRPIQAEFGGILIDTILEFLLEKEGGFQHLALRIDKDRVVGCIVVNGDLDDDIDGLIIWAKYVFLVMMDRWVH